MLNHDAEYLLQLMGKTLGTPGILLPEQMPDVIETILSAVAAEDTQRLCANPTDLEPVEQDILKEIREDHIPLVTSRARYMPILGMLRRSLSKRVPITWEP